MPDCTCHPPTPAPKAMAAVSVIQNPSVPEKVIIFGNNENNSLKVQSRKIGQDPSILSLHNELPSAFPKLAVPGQLASMVHCDMTCVYGITVDGNDKLQLALLSPVYSPISDDYTPKSGAFAGCSKKEGDTVWLYYITTNKNEEAVVKEVTLRGQNPPTVVTLSCDGLALTSQLFAFYATYNGKEFRYIVFQRKDKSIGIRNCDASSDDLKIIKESKTVAVKDTPLTAVVVPPRSDNDQPRLLVNFLSNREDDTYLAYANCEFGNEDLGDFEQDGEKAGIRNDTWTISPNTQIDSILDTINNRVIIWGYKDDDNGKVNLKNIQQYEIPYSKLPPAPKRCN